MASTFSVDRRIRWKRSLAVLLTSITSVTAYAGAVGLVGGGTDFGATIDARLPWHSPVLAGVVLAIGVAVPMTAAAWLLHADRGLTMTWISILSGGWLIGWIGVQLAVLRALNPMQAVCVLVGAVLVGLGISVRHQSESAARSVDAQGGPDVIGRRITISHMRRE